MSIVILNNSVVLKKTYIVSVSEQVMFSNSFEIEKKNPAVIAQWHLDCITFGNVSHFLTIPQA